MHQFWEDIARIFLQICGVIRANSVHRKLVYFRKRLIDTFSSRPEYLRLPNRMRFERLLVKFENGI